MHMVTLEERMLGPRSLAGVSRFDCPSLSWGFRRYSIILGKCHFLDIWGFPGEILGTSDAIFNYVRQMSRHVATFDLFLPGKCHFQMSRHLRKPQVPAQQPRLDVQLELRANRWPPRWPHGLVGMREDVVAPRREDARNL